MTTDLLRPQGCIRNTRVHSGILISPQSRSLINPNQMCSRRRKRSQGSIADDNNNRRRGSESKNRTVDSRSAAKKLVMGQVKILKRGEKLDVVKSGLGYEDLVLSSTNRLGPEPDTVQKQIRVSRDLYAGSISMLASPSPSSLPFPAFFTKKEKPIDAATSDILKLLRLDLV